MKVFGFNVRLSVSRESGRQPQAPMAQKGLSASPTDWIRGEEPRWGFNNAYEQVVWVYRAINVLAEQVANIPFLFSEGDRGRERLITSGPLPEFYARPHPLLDRFQYWELRVIWLMLRGECFRVPIWEAGPGRPRLRHVLMPDPARFQHIVVDHELVGWRYTGLGPRAPLASQVFLPEEIWHEKLPNPFDFWRGLPPLAVAAPAAATDYAAGSFMRGIIENNADPGVIVRTDKWLSDEQQAQIIAALRQRKRSAGTADRPMFLNGVAEIMKPELSSTDLQFLENRKFTRSEICAAFGVPEEIVTSTEHAKYDVMRGARLNFIENRVAPLCSRLEAGEAPVIAAIDPRAAGWFDLEALPIMQEARRARLAAARAGFEMGIPFNQLNRVLDLGFKHLPWGDRGYVSTSVVQAGESQPDAAETRTAPEVGHETNLPGRILNWIQRATTPAAQPAGEISGKFRRFLFQQRKSVLSRVSGPFDAPEVEKAFLAAAEQMEFTKGEAGEVRMGQCRAIGAELRRNLAEATAGGETAAQVAARVRALFNQASHRTPEIYSSQDNTTTAATTTPHDS